MYSLHKDWRPHRGQLPIINAVFSDNVPYTFIRCGRKFGKTEVCIYLCWRWALSRPGQGVYYLGPEYKQVKEIVWANQRMQSFASQGWIRDISKDQTRISFINNSFIKVDGSNNYESYRGIDPHFVVLDEFAQHDPRFIEAMWPNLRSNNAPLVMIGTPPAEPYDVQGNPHQYVQYQEEVENWHKEGKGRGFYVHADSFTNDTLDHDELRERARAPYRTGRGVALGAGIPCSVRSWWSALYLSDV